MTRHIKTVLQTYMSADSDSAKSGMRTALSADMSIIPYLFKIANSVALISDYAHTQAGLRSTLFAYVRIYIFVRRVKFHK